MPWRARTSSPGSPVRSLSFSRSDRSASASRGRFPRFGRLGAAEPGPGDHGEDEARDRDDLRGREHEARPEDVEDAALDVPAEELDRPARDRVQADEHESRLPREAPAPRKPEKQKEKEKVGAGLVELRGVKDVLRL